MIEGAMPVSQSDPDPYWDYDESECANCGGDGFTYGCSWDWQCDTYDAGEGTCLCERPCDWCNPHGLTAEQAAGRKYLGQSRDYGGFAGMTAAEMEGR